MWQFNEIIQFNQLFLFRWYLKIHNYLLLENIKLTQLSSLYIYYIYAYIIEILLSCILILVNKS